MVDKKITLTTVITAIITALLTLGGVEIADEIKGDDCEPIIQIETAEKISCPKYSLAYINDCETGTTTKYICNKKGKCLTTDEILSELG